MKITKEVLGSIKHVVFENLGYHPDDLVDAYIDSAEWPNGEFLTDDEIGQLNNEFLDEFYEQMLEDQIDCMAVLLSFMRI
jgi:hypothetical protein